MGLSQRKEQAAEAKRQHLESLLRGHCEDFARVWLVIAEQWYEHKTANPLPPATFHKHWLFRDKPDVEFYELHPAEAREAYPPKLTRALRTWNTCLTSVYVVFERVKQRLLSLPEVKNVEWIGVVPNPRLMLVWKGTSPDSEILRDHDCILITACDGSKYILDVSGWQFGYDDFFFPWESYKASFMVTDQQPRLRVPADEQDLVHRQYEDDETSLIFLQHYREWVTGASDVKLKEVTKNVSLSL